tara:strand:- start:155233 stop:155898 length:666 start_codon:yes stop_codon:yes gene_type:complete
MNKAAFYSTIAMLPVFAYAPLTSAALELDEPEAKTMKIKQPLQVNDQMISFRVDDAFDGDKQASIELDELLKDGPVVLTFYRGSWCPYCVTELTAIQQRLEKITDTGATVLAISPEVPGKTADLKEQKDLGFLFGTDHNNELAKKLALWFELDEETVKRYNQYGLDIPESNGTGTWELPVPATYVIDTDRTIRFAFVDENYKERADYDEVLKVLKKIQKDD